MLKSPIQKCSLNIQLGIPSSHHHLNKYHSDCDITHYWCCLVIALIMFSVILFMSSCIHLHPKCSIGLLFHCPCQCKYFDIIKHFTLGNRLPYFIFFKFLCSLSTAFCYSSLSV